MRKLTKTSLTMIAAALLLTGAALLMTGTAFAHDLRSPDARDAGKHPVATYSTVSQQKGTDLRSPDARDAETRVVLSTFRGYNTAYAPQPSHGHATGFAWGSAWVGAAAMFGFLGLLGTLMFAGYRRHGRHLATG